MTKVKKEKAKTGRPSLYTPELAEKICNLIRDGMSERKICALKDMPKISTLQMWKDKYPEFLEQSARARQESAETYAELALTASMELEELASDVLNGRIAYADGETMKDLPRGVLEAKKIYIQEMRREAGLRDDSRYGDRKKVALTGGDGGSLKIEQEIKLSVSEQEVLDRLLDEEF